MKHASKSSSRRIGQVAALALISSVAVLHSAQAAAPTVFDVATASIAPTGTFDLANNALIVRTTSFATINGYVTSGFAGGAWNGFGINSSVAAVGAFPTAIGCVDNTTLAAATFFGIAVGADDVLSRFTYYGDANLDGLVDNTDYAFTDAGFGTLNNGWVLGDYNYDGVVDNTDYAFIDAGFGGQGAPLGASFSEPAASVGVVPEPGAFALVALGALGLLNRRRR